MIVKYGNLKKSFVIEMPGVHKKAIGKGNNCTIYTMICYDVTMILYVYVYWYDRIA